jgi:hypothetical protein
VDDVSRRGVERSADLGEADQSEPATTSTATVAAHRLIRRRVTVCPTSRAYLIVAAARGAVLDRDGKTLFEAKLS